MECWLTQAGTSRRCLEKTGTSLARWMVDVDNDGNYELVCNVGDQAHFAAIKQNGTILWQNVVNTVKENGAYYPKIAAGKLFYGGAVSEKIWAINLSNGSLAWTVTKAGLTSLDISDKGLVYGAGTYVGILDYATGVAVSGWPVNVGFDVHEQVIVSGDLDGDGLDEIAMCETDGGRIRVLDYDGSYRGLTQVNSTTRTVCLLLILTQIIRATNWLQWSTRMLRGYQFNRHL